MDGLLAPPSRGHPSERLSNIIAGIPYRLVGGLAFQECHFDRQRHAELDFPSGGPSGAWQMHGAAPQLLTEASRAVADPQAGSIGLDTRCFTFGVGCLIDSTSNIFGESTPDDGEKLTPRHSGDLEI